MIEKDILERDEGIRLDKWFKIHHPEVPFGMLAKLLRTGKIRLDGKKAQVNTRVQAGQMIKFPELDLAPKIPNQESEEVLYNKYKATIQQLRDAIIYKDKDIIALNKPSGLAVQGGSKINVSVDKLTPFLRFEADTNPLLVHRLDKATTGALLLARSRKSAVELTHTFKSRDIQKTYLALVCGVPKPLKSSINTPLKKVKVGGVEKVIVDKNGEKAITEYEVVDYAADKLALVAMKPVTGRTHQLRVHSSSIGCPIMGDYKYSDTDFSKYVNLENIDRLHLHAHKLSFLFKGKQVNIKAKLPDYFQDNLKVLGFDEGVQNE